MHIDELWTLPNVLGICHDSLPRIRQGIEIENTRCVRVLVTKKVSVDVLNISQRIPQTIISSTNEELETDVVEIGNMPKIQQVPNPRMGKHGWLIGGISVGHETVTAGTHACIVFTADDSKYPKGTPLGLSNRHVTGGGPGLIYQPGLYDIPSTGLAKEECITGNFVAEAPYDLVDAAVWLPSRAWYKDVQLEIGMMKNLPIVYKIPTVALSVIKNGRTSGVTTGVVYATNVEIDINYGTEVKRIKQCFLTQTLDGKTMSQPGDSGSLMLHIEGDNRYVLGLLFAGSDSMTICSDMSNILTAFPFAITLDGPFNGNPVEISPPNARYTSSTASFTITIVAETKVSEILLVNKPETATANQPIKISGTLIDKETKEALKMRSIMIMDKVVVTNDLGYFESNLVFSAPGEYVVTIQFNGD